MDKLINAFSNDRSDYFTIFNQQSHVISFYENGDLLHEMKAAKENDNLFSVIFDGDTYIYTEKGDWLVEKRLGEEQSNVFSINGYKNVRLLKYLPDKKILIRAANKESEDKLLIFDVIKKEILFIVPLDLGKDSLFEFKDMYLENNLFTLLCFYRQKVSRYADDLDFKDTSLVTFLLVKDGTLTIQDSLYVVSVYDDFLEQSVTETGTEYRMKYPLFDYYSYYWPQEKCLSSSGNAVYYTKEFGGLIISNTTNGDIIHLIRLPERFHEEDFYYYNDRTGILTMIINETNEVCRYSIDSSVFASGNEIFRLNLFYNEAFENQINLQRNDPGEKFKRILLDAIDATVLKKEKAQKDDNIR